ncbi:MAG: macro domain-containing protein [Saprospiraceae bacterium]|nr:macro domain-containing protein [Saprospiraceae bacterium]
MIHFVKGNIFDSKTEALVNAVNTVGVMGKGIALEFKNRYPENYKMYKTACDDRTLKIGNVLSVKEGDGKTIINFPTKQHWKDASEYHYIKLGLRALKENIQEHKIKSIALPALGCGLGGLKWDTVKSMIESELKVLLLKFTCLNQFHINE